jgi:hypothetical protein
MAKTFVRLLNTATHRLPVAVSGVLLAGLATLAPSVFAQSTLNSAVAVDDPVKTCPVAEEADHQERALTSQRRSLALDRALRSESAFWKFFIDPSTSYLDRMAAAYQGGGLVPAEQLPRLWKASAEFEVLPTGVNPSPCKFIANQWAARGPEAWLMRKTHCVYLACQTKPETRNVLGYEVHLPETAIDYPLDLESRNGAPWLWQMARALSALEENVQKYYAHPDRYAQMTEVALRWHSDNYYERRVRAQALEQGPRNATWVRALMKLALDEGANTSLPSPPTFLYAYGNDSLHLEELIHVAHIVIIQQASDWSTAAGSAAQLVEMKKKTLGGTSLSWFGWGPLRSASSIMAIAQWAMNPGLSVEQRYTFAHSILEIIDDPSFKPNPTANSQEQAEAVLHVEQWLYSNQVWLEPRVASEIDGLAAVAAELGTNVQVPARIVTRWGVHPFLAAPASPGRF